MNIVDWIILFILLFAVAAAAVVFVILTIMNIGGIQKMRKESECEFYEGKKKECKGPEHCKDYNYFLAGKCTALEGQW